MLIHTVVSPFLTGPLRSPARLQNSFASESFFDELAAQAKQDPMQYRLRHLTDQRLKDVIAAAASELLYPLSRFCEDGGHPLPACP